MCISRHSSNIPVKFGFNIFRSDRKTELVSKSLFVKRVDKHGIFSDVSKNKTITNY